MIVNNLQINKIGWLNLLIFQVKLAKNITNLYLPLISKQRTHSL